MKTKRLVIAALSALNVVLLSLLIAQAAPLPSAMAQPGRSGGGYLCATAKAVGRTYEALHMIDLSTRRMYTFFPDSSGKIVPTSEPRDLDKDFGK